MPLVRTLLFLKRKQTNVRGRRLSQHPDIQFVLLNVRITFFMEMYFVFFQVYPCELTKKPRNLIRQMRFSQYYQHRRPPRLLYLHFFHPIHLLTAFLHYPALLLVIHLPCFHICQSLRSWQPRCSLLIQSLSQATRLLVCIPHTSAQHRMGTAAKLTANKRENTLFNFFSH